MPERIAIVALNIHRKEEGFSVFEKLTALEKIDLLKKRIDSLCQELSQKEPDALWIIGWREYGITEGSSMRAIASDAKAALKQSMLALTAKYPNLVILAGTVSTHKKVNYQKLEQIKQSYQEEKWIQYVRKREKDFPLAIDRQIEWHEKKLDDIVKKNPQEAMNAIRNTAYCFHGKMIKRHDKIAPNKETDFNTYLTNPIFQPAKGRNLEPFFTVTHPVTKREILFGWEICRENMHDILANASASKPLIHFVLSDAICLRVKKLFAKYAVQFDSLTKPREFLDENIVPQEINLYQNNLYKEAILTGPLEPLYPFEKQILDEFDVAIAAVSAKDKKKYQLLEEMKAEFIQSTDSISSYEMYKALSNMLATFENELVAKSSSEKITQFLNQHFGLFKSKEASLQEASEIRELMANFILKLYSLTSEQIEKHPVFKDLCSRDDAPMLSPNIRF